LIKPAFRDVKGFFRGFAAAKDDKAWGIINEKGDWVIKPGYRTISCEESSNAFILEDNTHNTIKYIDNGKLVDETASVGDSDYTIRVDQQ